MQIYWRSSRQAFYRHRHAEQERLRYLPYDCGGGLRSAIPCYIPACESGNDYGAVNPSSGTQGRYQFQPSTYAEWCVLCDWSPADQDRAAHDLYAAAGGGPWSCA